MTERPVTARQLGVLRGVREHPGEHPGRLAYVALGMSPAGRPDASVRNMLLALERRGLVRGDVFTDQWTLTDAGRCFLRGLDRVSTVTNMVCPDCARVGGQEHREGCLRPGDATPREQVLEWQLAAALAEVERQRAWMTEAMSNLSYCGHSPESRYCGVCNLLAALNGRKQP